MKNSMTIVGPEPMSNTGSRITYSTNIEAFFLMAKYNRPFRKRLLKKTGVTLNSCGISFSENESMILLSLSKAQLKNFIKAFYVPGISKRSLSNWKIAAAIILLLSTNTILEARNTRQKDYPCHKEQTTSYFQRIVANIFKQQENTVRGKVTGSDGEVLPGINVIVKGTPNGTVTDIDGNYTLNVPQDSVLIFSLVGMISKEINVGSRSTINVQLQDDMKLHECLEVVSYGHLPGRRLFKRTSQERKLKRKNRKSRKKK